MNWALRTNFQTSDSFKKAQILLEEEKERLKMLEGRLKFLRIIRDSTLFVLSLGEAFFWIEAIGIIFVFVILPLILVYGDKLGLEAAAATISKQRWQVQRMLFFFITFSAICIAGLRTLFGFERIRTKVLAKAKIKAEKKRQQISDKAAINAMKADNKKEAQKKAAKK